MKRKYELVFTKTFVKDLRKLDRALQVRVLKETRILEEDPYRAGEFLVGPLRGKMSLRVGRNFRVIYMVLGEKVILEVGDFHDRAYRRAARIL